MIEVKVRLPTEDEAFKEGDQLFIACGKAPGDKLVVEPITVTNVREFSGSYGFKDDSHYSYKQADWTSATGSTSGFTFASTNERYVPNSRPEVLIPDEGGETVLCYEQIGTAVTLTVLVGEMDPELAKAVVLQALSGTIVDSEEPSTREAYDAAEHLFDRDGKLIAESVPNWHSPLSRFALGGGSGHQTVEGCTPVHEAQYEIMKDRVEREVERNKPRIGRPPGSKNKPKAKDPVGATTKEGTS